MVSKHKKSLRKVETMNSSESKEMYLETMLELFLNNKKIRVTDVAKSLNVSKASVNSAFKKLEEENLVQKEYYGDIKFTEQGYEKALKIKEKHDLITRFFIKTLNIDPKIAENDACRFEHFASKELIDAIKKYLD